jgi:hypothetical protein
MSNQRAPRDPDLLPQALSGAVAAPVPCAPLYLDLFYAGRKRLELAALYRERAAGADELTLTLELEAAAQAEAWRRAYGRLRRAPAWLPGRLGPARTEVDGTRMVFRPGQCLVYPPGAFEPSGDLLAPYDSMAPALWERETPFDTPQAVDALLPLASPEDYLADDRALCARGLQERVGAQTCPYLSTGSPYWACYSLFGFAGLMENQRRRPELILRAAERALHNRVVYAQAVRRAGFRVLFIEECLSGSDLISPQDYRRFVWPCLRDLLAECRGIGLQTVFYHCGGVEDRLELLANLPTDALAFEESKKGFVIDLARIRRETGPEKVLFGNTDVTLVRDGSPERIVAEVQRQYAEAGPRFVVSIGSPLTLDTAEEKIAALAEAAATLR